jgi:hypothetical protein
VPERAEAEPLEDRQPELIVAVARLGDPCGVAGGELGVLAHVRPRRAQYAADVGEQPRLIGAVLGAEPLCVLEDRL